jgi:hypothetical protein
MHTSYSRCNCACIFLHDGEESLKSSACRHTIVVQQIQTEEKNSYDLGTVSFFLLYLFLFLQSKAREKEVQEKTPHRMVFHFSTRQLAATIINLWT